MKSQVANKIKSLRKINVSALIFFIPVAASFSPLDIFFLVGGLVVAWMVIDYKNQIKAFSQGRMYLILIFMVFMLLVAVINRNFMGMIAVFFLTLIVVYIARLRSQIHRTLFEGLMMLIGIGSAFSLYYCTIDFYTTTTYKLYEFFMKLIPLPFSFGVENFPKINSASTYVNSNFYGHISAFIALIAISYILSSLKKLYHREWKYLLKLSFYLIVLGINLVALNLTQSRSAFIGFIVGVAVLLIVFDARIFIAVSIPVFLFIVFQYDAFLYILPRLDSAALSLEYRLSLYKAAFQEILKNPIIGKGFYTYPLVYQNYTTGYQLHTHNLFLELWLDSGLVGLALLAGYFSSYVTRPLDQWVKRNKEYLPLVCGILALEFVNGLTDAVLIFPQSFILLSIVLLSLELNKEDDSKKEHA